MNKLISDELLAAQTVAGSHEAFRILVQRHYSPTVRICRGILHNHDDAEDAAQEVFLRVHRVCHTYLGKGPWAGWLRRLTVNECLNRLGTSHRRDQMEVMIEDLLPSCGLNGGDPFALAVARHEGERIRDAIHRLPPRHQRAIVLRVVEELTYGEIAVELHAPVNTVRSWLRRGRLELRGSLMELQDDECVGNTR